MSGSRFRNKEMANKLMTLGSTAEGSKEVAHKSEDGIPLIVLRATSSGSTFVEHIRTGERVSVAQGTALLFSHGWADVRGSSQPPVWL
eukprot:3678502-Amphidinium_carterae.1